MTARAGCRLLAAWNGATDVLRGTGWPGVLALALSAAMPLHAQDRPDDAEPSPGVETGRNAGTGDAWIDAHLEDMATYATRYRDAFVDEIVRYQQAPRDLVEGALGDRSLQTGDVWFACAFAQATGRPCRAVLDARRADASAPWSVVISQLDVAPPADLHRRLRDEVRASYARWARPLVAVDAKPSKP